MEWSFRSDQPIYTQLAEKLRMEIVSGRYRPGERAGIGAGYGTGGRGESEHPAPRPCRSWRERAWFVPREHPAGL